MIDPSGAGTFPQSGSQSGQLIAGTDGKDFHAGIGIIAHPPNNFQDVRLALDKPAEADALNAPAHEKAPSEGGRLSLGGRHGLVQ
jgi:hypothetical protein